MKVLISASGEPQRVVRSADDCAVVEEQSGIPLAAWTVIHAFPSGAKERKLARRWPPPETAERLPDYFDFLISDQSAERIALFDWLRNNDEEKARDTETLLNALRRYEIQHAEDTIPDGWSVEEELKVRGEPHTIIHHRRTPHKVAQNPIFVVGLAGILLFAALELYSGKSSRG